MNLADLGRILLALGGLLAIVGAVLVMLGRVPFVGRLPGDIVVRRGNVTCFVPIVTSLLLSLLLTVLLNILIRLLGR